MSGWYYRTAGTRAIGPVSADELRVLAEHGSITSDSEVSHEQVTRGEWVSANRIKELKCQEPSVAQDVTGEIVQEPVSPEPTESTIVLRESGGSIQTVLSHNIRLNKLSSLKREFITVINKELPAGLTGCVGVTTAYEPETDYTAGQYIYASRFAVKALEDVRAFETRFLLFNVWGRHVQTLTATEIADVQAGSVRQCEGKWSLFDENEACEHYASIAYVATIRTNAGQVYDADIDPVVAEAKRFSSKFTDTDLEPTPIKR